MSGAVPVLHPCAFMAWTATNLPLLVLRIGLGFRTPFRQMLTWQLTQAMTSACHVYPV
jgi:hypothetical protein